MRCREIDRERKEERMRPTNRKLHELLSGTTRLDSGYEFGMAALSLRGEPNSQ